MGLLQRWDALLNGEGVAMLLATVLGICRCPPPPLGGNSAAGRAGSCEVVVEMSGGAEALSRGGYREPED